MYWRTCTRLARHVARGVPRTAGQRSYVREVVYYQDSQFYRAQKFFHLHFCLEQEHPYWSTILHCVLENWSTVYNYFTGLCHTWYNCTVPGTYLTIVMGEYCSTRYCTWYWYRKISQNCNRVLRLGTPAGVVPVQL